MSSPMTVSLQVPYADNEQQFLVLAVQTAVRTFRRLNAHSHEGAIPHSSSKPTPSSSSSALQPPER
jgi:hypothetical protein